MTKPSTTLTTVVAALTARLLSVALTMPGVEVSAA